MQPVRVAVIGVGGIGSLHLGLIPQIPGYQLTAVCDVNQDDLRTTAEELGVPGFSSTQELLGSGIADAVVIGTPPFLHASHTAEALEAGLHVYCEKPFVVTSDQGYELARMAAGASLRIQVGLQYRFRPDYSLAKKLIDEGELGQIYRANLHATNWYRTQHYFEVRPWRKLWATAGGGILMNQAIHQVDSFLWMVGMPSAVTAYVWRGRHDAEVEDDAIALLEFGDRARGLVTASGVNAVGGERLEIHGEMGSILIEGGKMRMAKAQQTIQSFTEQSDHEWASPPLEWEEPVESPGTMSDWMIACHNNFLDAINAGVDPVNNAQEGTRAVELANAIYLSALGGDKVTFPLDQKLYRTTFDQLAQGTKSLPLGLGA